MGAPPRVPGLAFGAGAGGRVPRICAAARGRGPGAWAGAGAGGPRAGCLVRGPLGRVPGPGPGSCFRKSGVAVLSCPRVLRVAHVLPACCPRVAHVLPACCPRVARVLPAGVPLNAV
jgi:hypothetical protein